MLCAENPCQRDRDDGPDRRHLDDLLTFAHGLGTIGLLQQLSYGLAPWRRCEASARVAGLTFAEARLQRWLAVADLVAARQRGRFAHQAASSRSALLDRTSHLSAISSKLLPFIASLAVFPVSRSNLWMIRSQ